MGPIQSGMNQIIQNIMHSATMYAGGRAIKDVKTEVGKGTEATSKAIRGVKSEVKKGTEAIEGVKTELRDVTRDVTKEWQNILKQNPKMDKDYATAMASANITPEEAKKDMNYILNTDPNNNEPPPEGYEERMRAGETAYKSQPNDYSALPEIRLKETAVEKIKQLSNFERLKKKIDSHQNLKNFTENVQLPSSINKKIKQTSLNNGMPNIKHRNAGEK